LSTAESAFCTTGPIKEVDYVKFASV